MDNQRTKKNHKGSSSRKSLTRIFAVLACFSLPIATLAACTETTRGLGESCLKGEDCTSGVCVGSVCAGSPPYLQGPPLSATDSAPDGTTSDDASDDTSTLPDVVIDSSFVDSAADSGGD